MKTGLAQLATCKAGLGMPRSLALNLMTHGLSTHHLLLPLKRTLIRCCMFCAYDNPDAQMYATVFQDSIFSCKMCCVCKCETFSK